jgi:hypothetical protein
MPYCAASVEQLHQRDLGPVQLPVAGEDAAVLVAVAVAQHDVLLAAGALPPARQCRAGRSRPHDGRGIAQVADGLEQRHHDQVATAPLLSSVPRSSPLPFAAAAPPADR